MTTTKSVKRWPWPRPAADRRLAGIGYMIVGVSSFATMDALGKWLVRDITVSQILAVRSTFVVAVLLLLAPRFGGLRALQTEQPGAHWLRALCGVLAFLLFFTSVRYLPLADAVAIAFGTPFMVTALSVPVLGEHVDGRRWAAIGAGVGGVLLIVRPTGAAFRPAALLVVASSVTYALVMVLTRWIMRRSGGKEKTFTFLFYTFAIQVPTAWVLTRGDLRPMSPTELGLVAAMGVFALVGYFGITCAFQSAPASVLAPFEYMALVWATGLGVAVFGEFPGATVWLGVAIIVAAGIYTLRRENTIHELREPS